MFSMEEIEALVKEHYPHSMIGRLAHEVMRVRHILHSYMDAEHHIGWTFMEYQYGSSTPPAFESYAEVKRLLIDPVLARLWPAANDSTILSIMLHACLRESRDNQENYPASRQIVMEMLNPDAREAMRKKSKKLRRGGYEQ